MARRRIGFDRSAYAFAVAARLTNTTQIRAVNGLTIGTKFDGLWPQIQVLYPFAGGTALAHRLNLRNPVQHPITWSGALSHTAMGVACVAAGGGQGLTTLTPTSNEIYVGLYVSQSSGPAQSLDFVAREGAGLNTGLTVQWTGGGGNFQGDIGSASGGLGRLTANTASSVGYRAVSRAGTAQELYVNGASVSTGTFTVTAVPNQPFSLFNSPSASWFLSSPARTYAAAVVASGLIATQHSALYAHIQAYQQALGVAGRAV